MKIGNREFQTRDKTYVCGIINATPDSFSDGGRLKSLDDFRRRAYEMADEGADIIDVGGESTRPGYKRVPDEEEIGRVVPVITAIKKETGIPVSVDTYKASVARAAIDAGADLINDIWGLKADPDMTRTLKESGLPCILMHNREDKVYADLISDMKKGMMSMTDDAINAGIDREKIIIDVGLGFAKDTDDNLRVMKHLDVFSHLGFPFLVGASRKSFIGNSLKLPVNERLEGTLLTTVLAAMAGAFMVRVHDVKENVRIIRMYEAVRNS